MSSSRELSLLLGLGLILAAGTFASAAEPGYFGYGTKATAEQIAGWDIDARGGDGVGLPPGNGTVERGTAVYAEQSGACHRRFRGSDGRFSKLVRGPRALPPEPPEPPG